jgi:hypothetical protein
MRKPGKREPSRLVARAAATGGSRVYKEARPWGYYTLLALVAVLGFSGIYYARYQAQHPASAAQSSKSKKSVQPTIGTVWYEAVGFQICSTFARPLPPNPNSSTAGITSMGNGLVRIAPRFSVEEGRGANLATFATEYPGLTLTSTTLQLPGGKQYRAGGTCPGQRGKARIYFKEYSSPNDTKGRLLLEGPMAIRLRNGHMITVAYVADPSYIKPPPYAPALIQVMTAQKNEGVPTTTAPAGRLPPEKAPSTTKP